MRAADRRRRAAVRFRGGAAPGRRIRLTRRAMNPRVRELFCIPRADRPFLRGPGTHQESRPGPPTGPGTPRRPRAHRAGTGASLSVKGFDMHLYRKVIPKIAREIVRALNSKGDIVVDDGNLDEAELDLAAVMVEYCNQEDRITQEAKDAISRRGLPHERFAQVKKGLADARGFKLGDDGLEEVINQMIEAFFASKNI